MCASHQQAPAPRFNYNINLGSPIPRETVSTVPAEHTGASNVCFVSHTPSATPRTYPAKTRLIT